MDFFPNTGHGLTSQVESYLTTYLLQIYYEFLAFLSEHGICLRLYRTATVSGLHFVRSLCLRMNRDREILLSRTPASSRIWIRY
jgi:hypothetical protein